MERNLRSSLAIVSLVGLALVASACGDLGALGDVDGSGVPATTTVDVAEFDRIAVTNVFDVAVTVQDGPPSVEVTVDDNLIDDLDVRVVGNALHVGFEPGSYDTTIPPMAVVSVASLREVDVSGAASLAAHGVAGESLDVDVSGASSVTVSGAVTTLSIEGSGASTIRLADLATTTAVVELSGASSAVLGSVERVDGDLSGAAVLSAPAGAIGSIELSGGSSIERR